MIIQKFISRRFLLTMLWILLAVFVIVRDGDFVKEVVAIVCVGCAALLSCIFVIGTTWEKVNIAFKDVNINMMNKKDKQNGN